MRYAVALAQMRRVLKLGARVWGVFAAPGETDGAREGLRPPATVHVSFVVRRGALSRRGSACSMRASATTDQPVAVREGHSHTHTSGLESVA